MLKIAHRAQVSAMTVSRVLNHSAAVSESTRAKVLQIAGEMGYRHYPNAISRMLRGERSRSIGVLACFARPHLAGEAMHRIGKVLLAIGGANLLIGLVNSFNSISRFGWANLLCATLLMYALGRIHGKKESLEKDRELHE